MAQFIPIGPLETLVYVDNDPAVTLPNNAPTGQKYRVTDNLGVGNAVTINAPFQTGTSILISGTSGWVQDCTWTGSFYGTS